MGMTNIDKQEIQKASEIIALAMFNDDLHKYFFPLEKQRMKKTQSLYKYRLKSHFSNVCKSSSMMEGLSIWEKPFSHANAISFRDAINGISLLFQIGFRDIIKMIKYQFWSIKIKESLIKDPYWYLELIAVHPKYQGKGIAGKMIKPTLELATNNNGSVYLETHNFNNISIYEKYGFKLILTEQIPGTVVNHYCMLRK